MKAAQIFNGYIGSHLCFHLGDNGIFDLFRNSNIVNKSDLKDFHERSSSSEVTELLIDFSLKFGIFNEDSDSSLQLSELGQDLMNHIGFFTWAVGGYGEFMRDFPKSADNSKESFSLMIDGGNVALGSRQANRTFMWEKVINQLKNESIKKIVDLGSGNAGALVSLCKEFPDISAIGIDISKKAIELAKENVNRNGMSHRISIYNQDVLKAIDDPSLTEIFKSLDSVMSFMMMHDLFSENNPIEVLKRLRDTFPNAERFFIADTFLSEETELSNKTPIFSYGFEYVHHFMEVELFRKEHYISFFKKAGFSIMETVYLNVPNTYLFVLKP